MSVNPHPLTLGSNWQIRTATTTGIILLIIGGLRYGHETKRIKEKKGGFPRWGGARCARQRVGGDFPKRVGTGAASKTRSAKMEQIFFI